MAPHCAMREPKIQHPAGAALRQLLNTSNNMCQVFEQHAAE
jgi:hypothetical protein